MAAKKILGIALPTAIVVYGCRTPTQVTLEIGTNVVCSDMRGVDIVVSSDAMKAEGRAGLLAAGPRFTSASTNACEEGAAPRRIGTLVVTPEGAGGAVIVIGTFGNARPEDCTTAHFASECIVARRRFSFVEHTALVMPIVLDPSCAGIPCNATSTCVGKICVDSEVDCSGGTCSAPGERGADGGLVEVDGASPLIEAGPVRDAEPDVAVVRDAGQDAPADANPDVTSNVPLVCPPARRYCEKSHLPQLACQDLTCCYTNPPNCGPDCPAMQGCCTGANDCPTGQECCASTPNASSSTTFTCQPTGCQTPVCSRGNPTCRSSCDMSRPYSTDPDFFHCL
jgi:hypothetical protein